MFGWTDQEIKIDKLARECAAYRAAIEEHIECIPGMYANECVGLGGADGLKEVLAKYPAPSDGK